MDFLKIIDHALGTHFDAPVYDPAKGRAKLVRVIDLAAQQYTNGSTKAPNRSWKAGNNSAVRFSPKLDGKPLLLEGKADSYVPAERFQEFLTGMKAAVEAGQLDEQIKATLDGEAVNKLGIATRTRAPSSGLGSRAQLDSPEGMAKFTEKHGPAPSDDHVPNSKGTKWVTRAAMERGKLSAANRGR